MKKTILFTIIFSTLLVLSCKKTEESSETLAAGSPCACDDFTCWKGQTPALRYFTCILDTGLVTPGVGGIVRSAIPQSLKKTIKSRCNVEVTAHLLTLIQQTPCSANELKKLAALHNDTEENAPKKGELKQKLADFEDPDSSLKTYDCSRENTNCNLSAMYLYGIRKHEKTSWGTNLYDHCKDSCLSSSKTTFCRSSLNDYIRNLNDSKEFRKKGITKYLSSSCTDSCIETTQCSQAETLCLEQCCGGDMKCVMDAKK